MYNYKSLFLVPIVLLCVTNLDAQNRLMSRIYFKKPPLFISPTQTNFRNLSCYSIKIEEPVDRRFKYYGEPVYKKVKTQPIKDFFELPLTLEIQKKINIDFATSQMEAVYLDKKLIISSVIEVFYPDVRGFLLLSSFTKIRLRLTARLNNEILINREYEEFYKSNATDKDFEGHILMTLEQAANVNIGMTLRKVLDSFYKDLEEKLQYSNTQKNENLPDYYFSYLVSVLPKSTICSFY